MIPPGQFEMIALSHGRLWGYLAANPAITYASMGRIFQQVSLRRIKAPHGSFKILRASRDR